MGQHQLAINLKNFQKMHLIQHKMIGGRLEATEKVVQKRTITQEEIDEAKFARSFSQMVVEEFNKNI
jgi:hypothetical protein